MWVVLKQVYSAFGDIHSFLETDDLPPSKLQLLEILSVVVNLKLS